MTEEGYAEIERLVIATPARPVTEAPALDADLRQRETVEALEQACGVRDMRNAVYIHSLSR
jgi:hypothetical protein